MKPLNQTYAASVGKKPFNWLSFLNQKKITQEEWGKAHSLANNWPTCACGNMCAVIPRRYSNITGPGAPVDKKLYDLGMTFARQISDHRRSDARRTFERIEKRSLELIREINKPAAIKLAKKAQKLLDDLAQLGYSPAEVFPLSK